MVIKLMKEFFKNLVNKKAFHFCVITIIIVLLLFILGLVILRYNVEGETNMPFNLSKVSVISSIEGIDKENEEYRWDFNVNQNNDIYLYLEKNQDYEKTEIIDSVVLENFNIQREGNIGQIKIYRPNAAINEGIFKNSEENVADKIEYTGDYVTEIKELKISNQGDIIIFRCANDNVAEYKSNEDEINHSELLKKANVLEENLKTNLGFDIIIKLKSGKEYKSSVLLELPAMGIVENGTSFYEKTDLTNLVFKRIKN